MTRHFATHRTSYSRAHTMRPTTPILLTLIAIGITLLPCAILAAPLPASFSDPAPSPVQPWCGLQLYCPIDQPCMPNQVNNGAAMVTFDLSTLHLNFTKYPNATDYVAYDTINTYYANVCGYTNRLCPAPYNTPSDFGLVAETSNPAVCYPAAHIPAPTGWTLVNPEDATQGVQIRYIDGEYSACPGESGNPRQVNYIFVCSEETPLNPFANALTDSNNPCNYTFFFSSSFACPTIEYFPLVHPVSNGLSGGSIFLILLACIIFVYVIGTMAWNAKRHQARTWHELRPHPIFWSNFLLNVRFGIHMTWLWLRSKWNRQAKEELQENEYQDMDRNYGSAGSGGVIVAGSGVVYNPLPSPAAARRGSQIVQQAPPVPTTVEEPQPKSNYSSLFASERDDILDGFHAPLTRPTEVPPPTQELYAALGEEEESGTAAAGGGDNTKEKKKKKTNKNKH